MVLYRCELLVWMAMITPIQALRMQCCGPAEFMHMVCRSLFTHEVQQFCRSFQLYSSHVGLEYKSPCLRT